MSKKYYEVIAVAAGNGEGVPVDFVAFDSKSEFQSYVKGIKGDYGLIELTDKEKIIEALMFWNSVYKEELYDTECIGTVGVDSGMLMITDPCYVKDSTQEKCEEIYKTIDNEFNSGQILNTFAVALKTAHGDGMYDVLAKRDEHGRITKIEILFD